MSSLRYSFAKGSIPNRGVKQATLVQAKSVNKKISPKFTMGKTLKIYNYDELTPIETKAVMARPRIDFSKIFNIVRPIVDKVREEGDAAVKEYTAQFDKVTLSDVCVPIESIPDVTLPEEVTCAFDVAYNNIKAFHEAQQTYEAPVETMPGVVCRRVTRPINSVGVYVPGGSAVLPSSALMLAVPAKIAGCRTIVLATPPRADGSITPEVVYCAKKAGVTHILKAGGAQAVASLAWGTATCPKVDKIFGPGNQFVTAAKMLLANSEAMISIDMPAGPSEVLVIADKDAPASHVAIDLLSQAEHGPDSQVVLVALPGVDLDKIESEIDRLVSELPRGPTAARALKHSYAIKVSQRVDAIAFSNAYAPEHLIVNVADAEQWVPELDNAGSVFVGRWTPESVGDYASGTNHVLPTYGYSKMYSGVNLEAFQKKMTVQSLSWEGLQRLGPHVVKMAEVEGLDAHRRAVSIRLGLQGDK